MKVLLFIGFPIIEAVLFIFVPLAIGKLIGQRGLWFSDGKFETWVIGLLFMLLFMLLICFIGVILWSFGFILFSINEQLVEYILGQ